MSSSSNASTVTIEPPLLTAVADHSVVTYDNVPFTVHLTNDIQEFGVVVQIKMVIYIININLMLKNPYR